ncbi:MAG: homoserine kinase [Woeseia sp.]
MSERFISAFAPASIGNVGVGFDMLGLALQGVGDRVSVRRRQDDGIVVAEVLAPDGQPHPDLSTQPERNTASIAAAALWRTARARGGLEIVLHKGIPLQSGMGSSAASAVAAVVATNALLESPFEPGELLTFALEGEKFASGGLHADNVAPSLLGGLVLCPSMSLPETVRIKPPTGLSSVLVHPDLKVDTAKARRDLARIYSLEQWLTQQGYLATFVLACERDDHRLIARSLQDVIIEPQRAASVPCFQVVKRAALNAGALGCSLSGSGPSIFALCSDGLAPTIAKEMAQACRNSGVACESWISPMNSPGAQVQDGE